MAPAAEPAANGQAPGQAAKADGAASAQADAQSDNQAPGQAKKADAAASSDTQPGVKPDSTTTHWTHCRTGGAGTSTALCTAEAGTPATKPDVSKRYGNGRTAAQIAVARGAPNGTLITGPGNSQPHKVTACGKPNNKSGGVDVHAVKSYDASACQPAATQPTTPRSRRCAGKTTVTTSTQVTGVLHGKAEHLMTNPKSARFSKRDDAKVIAPRPRPRSRRPVGPVAFADDDAAGHGHPGHAGYSCDTGHSGRAGHAGCSPVTPAPVVTAPGKYGEATQGSKTLAVAEREWRARCERDDQQVEARQRRARQRRERRRRNAPLRRLPGVGLCSSRSR